MSLLIYGIGNPGRQDDGLGISVIELLEKLPPPPGVTLESNYQLNAEDALLVAESDSVIFVDSTVEPDAKAPFEVREVEPTQEIAFSTHAMGVRGIVGLCHKLYKKRPRVLLMTLPGYSWEINENLSPQAEQNLTEAVRVLAELIRSGEWGSLRRGTPSSDRAV